MDEPLEPLTKGMRADGEPLIMLMMSTSEDWEEVEMALLAPRLAEVQGVSWMDWLGEEYISWYCMDGASECGPLCIIPPWSPSPSR